MGIAESLLPEFDQEMSNTRRVLERVPDGKFDFKPAEKAPALGWLAWHVAMMPGWATSIIECPSFDVGQPPSTLPPRPETRQGLLDAFEAGAAVTREKLAAASDEAMMQPWRLHKGDFTIIELPRVAIWRGLIMNHLIHHRAQLTVYLRMTGVPIPGLYGPSADEPME